MTKLASYDELEIGERSRVCGGVVFQKFMKKRKCGSSSQKSEGPALTSSSSSSSSQTSSTSFNNMYDPSKTHFCMPRQIEGVGTTMSAESKDYYKLDFKLQVDDHADFYINNKVDRTDLFLTKKSEETDVYAADRARSHTIIQLDPQVVNDLKTKYMQSIQNGTFEGSSKIQQYAKIIPVKESSFEKTMSLRKDPEKAFKPEQSIKLPHNGFLMKEADDINQNGDVNGSWNELQYTRIEQKTNEEQALYESKARVLRKEMTSFRKELNDVKNSLPNQFHTNHFTDMIDGTKEASKRNNKSCRRESDAVKKSLLKNQLDSKQYNNQVGAWNFTAFASKASKEKTHNDANRDQKYFKNNWNLTFQDQENNNKTEPSHSAPKIVSSEIKDHNMIQNIENSNSVLERNLSFPECPEMPFDQGLNPVEIEMIESTASPEERNSKEHSNNCDEGQKYIALSSQNRQESGKIESQNSEETAYNSGTGDIRASSIKLNYEEDMELVRKLLKKYGEDTDETLKVDKVNRTRAITDAPTDAWFHRHAGMCRKSGKSPTLKADEKSNLQQGNSRINEHSLPVLAKKINRVHFKTSAVDEEIKGSKSNVLKNMRGNLTNVEVGRHPITRNAVVTSSGHSPGKLSDKIKFWEARNI